ncbi:hypothetical protein FS749_008880 [Ceratobasidium sp. UAMH 11750]|nr:hypothetical protein FS749_008880 [Ceratobasidium sp. UAMH 11750]
MSAWNVSAIFTNVSVAWEQTFNAFRTIQSIDTVVLLQEVDEILRSTSDLLENHRTLLPPGEYESFKAQHRTYQWMWNDEKREYGNVKKQALQQHRVSKELATEQEACQNRANNLLESLRTYRSKLLDASKNAAVGPIPAFPDEEPAPATSQPAEHVQTPPSPPNMPTPSQLNIPISSERTVIPFPGTSSPPKLPRISALPTNVGLMGQLRLRSATDSQTGARTTGQTLFEDQGFAIAVAHIAVDPENHTYERIISVKVGDRQVMIPDPELHVLEDSQVDVDDKTLAAVCVLVAKRMLDPEMFQKTVEELHGEID